MLNLNQERQRNRGTRRTEREGRDRVVIHPGFDPVSEVNGLALCQYLRRENYEKALSVLKSKEPLNSNYLASFEANDGFRPKFSPLMQLVSRCAYETQQQQHEIFSILVRRGGSVNLVSELGKRKQTALTLCLCREPLPLWMARLLLEHGADASEGLFAARSVEAIRLLIEKGADFNSFNEHGETPLMSFSQSLLVDQVLFLMKKVGEIDPTLTNSSGMTALQLAERNPPLAYEQRDKWFCVVEALQLGEKLYLTYKEEIKKLLTQYLERTFPGPIINLFWNYLFKDKLSKYSEGQDVDPMD